MSKDNNHSGFVTKLLVVTAWTVFVLSPFVIAGSTGLGTDPFEALGGFSFSDANAINNAVNSNAVDIAALDDRIETLEGGGAGTSYDSDVWLTFGSGEGAARMQHNSSGNYFNIVPYNSGEWDTDNRLYFDTDESGGWRAVGGFHVVDGNQTIYSDTPIFHMHDYANDCISRLWYGAGSLYIQSGADGEGATESSGNIYFSGYSNENVNLFTVRYGDAWNTIWHAGNDGAGSTLDADSVDGLAGSYVTSGTDPDVAGNGHITHDTDGAWTADDGIVRAHHADGQWPVGQKIVTYQIPFNVSGAESTAQWWFNRRNMDFTFTQIDIRTDTEDLTVDIDECTSWSNTTILNKIVDVTVSGAGTGVYTDTTLDNDGDVVDTVIDAGHGLSFDFGEASVGVIMISGWFNANVD